jgi:hypothetical protein
MRHLGHAPRLIAATLVVSALSLLLWAGPSSASARTAQTASAVNAVQSGSTAGADAAGTVWLCRPGVAPDPCTSSLSATVVPATGQRTTESSAPAPDPAFDCFYVYPTVSLQKSDNANLKIQAGEIGAAVSQAAPFSQDCRVWAPMYRQRTSASLAKGLGNDPAADAVAYKSLLAGWTDYLAHYNDGRPVIFIGHSQGAAMLIRLLSGKIDSDARLRDRMVSAIIAGGNVTVPDGRDVGATFRHIPLCTSAGQIGCVIAYSTFPQEPPADSLFGRPGQGVSLQSGQTKTKGLQVACVNPAALGGGTGALTPWLITSSAPPPPPAVMTLWVIYPNLYTAICRNVGGASWLQVNDVAASRDTRPVIKETLGPTWGYHADDINVASGNLVNDVQLQEKAYTAAHN